MNSNMKCVQNKNNLKHIVPYFASKKIQGKMVALTLKLYVHVLCNCIILHVLHSRNMKCIVLNSILLRLTAYMYWDVLMVFVASK